MSKKSSDPSYALIRAVRKGDIESAKTLIDTYGLSHSTAWSRGYNLLRDSLQNEHPNVTELLLERGSKVNSKSKRLSETPLHFAVRLGYTNIVSMLLERKADVDAKDNFEMTPLQRAVDRNCLEIVKLLIKAKANIKAYFTSGGTALHHAVEFGRLEIIKELLNNGAPVNAGMLSECKNGYTPLHCAVSTSNEVVVKLLLRKGAKINATSGDKRTPLILAAFEKRDKMVKLLLEEGANYETRDMYGKSILLIAVERAHLQTIQHILRYQPNINDQANRKAFHLAIKESPGEKYQKIVEVLLNYGFSVDPKDAKDNKLLHAAVKHGYIQVVEALLKHGANVDSKHVENQGMTLLHTAAFHRRCGMVSLLLRNNANVNAKDAENMLPIHYALKNNDTNMTKLLLKSSVNVAVTTELLQSAVKKESRDIVEILLNIAPNINVNATDKEGRTALHYTALEKEWDWQLYNFRGKEASQKEPVDSRAQIARMLIKRGACVDAKTKNGESVLHLAAEGGHAEIVKILLAEKASVDPLGKNNMTPLHLASKRNNPNIVKMLIDSGANVNAKQNTGMTPLHVASQNGHDDVVQLLIERNANLDAQDKDKSTPLHRAVMNGYCDVATILLESACYVDPKNNLGRTPLHLAAKLGYPSIATSLLDHGADVNDICNVGMTPLDYATVGTTEYHNRNDDRLLAQHLDYCFDDEDFFDLCSNDGDTYSDPDYDDYFDYFGEDDFSISDCPCEDIAEILEQHIIAILALGLYVSEKNLKALDLEHEHLAIIEHCKMEIADMKSQKIGDNNVTYYDVLTKDLNHLVIYTRNKTIVEALELDNLNCDFPTYSVMLARRITVGQKRNGLLCSSLKSLAALTGYVLPDLSAIELFNYLSNKDLENLTNADPSEEDNDS